MGNASGAVGRSSAEPELPGSVRPKTRDPPKAELRFGSEQALLFPETSRVPRVRSDAAEDQVG